MDPSSTSRPANRLADETSPYLLQHAHNPVDWYPWGPEALERARREERLILLSIGYSACHWCHVMERESFENDEVAALMNEHYVNVKVDREERPDLDDIYMAATVAMNHGQGGWPMTVFLTPELEPVFAGTYFPPDDRYGRPGFKNLLGRIAELWRDDPASVRQTGKRLVAHLRREKEQAVPGLAVGSEVLEQALEQYRDDFDPEWGGFGGAPKFPPAAGLSLLLRLYRRTGDGHALEMVEKTLEAMARGGIYDQVGGGFARYSVDERWLVPHFEKMLYDNALLASVYLEAFQVTGKAFYRQIASETLDYVRREMTSPDGGFYSATDADSEGVEGKFFVWTPEEIGEILDADVARAFCAYYDIREGGNWEGCSIPNCPRPLEEVAAELGRTPEDLESELAAARERVYAARQKRVPPALDDKVLTAWNGMMIQAFAQAADVLGEARWLEAARAAADFLLARLKRGDGGLLRTYRAGKAHLDAYLEDYAWLAEALVTTWEASGEVAYLREAEGFVERLLSEFLDRENGGFFNTAEGHEKLILRYRDGTDGATPSGNAIAASALARLAAHLGRDDFRDAAVGALKAHGRLIERFPRAFARSLTVADFLLEGPVELAFVGRLGEEGFDALRRAVAGRYLPNKIQAIVDPDDDPGLPLTAGKTRVDGRAALYVCRGYACQAPITEPAALDAALGEAGSGATAPGGAVRLVSRLPGRATAAGTACYAERHRGGIALGETGLTASRLGFGAYRVSDVIDEHRDALRHALRSGVNLIDTSTNYTDGASERLVGTVVAELVASGELEREAVIVVSKIGYVQGQNHQLAERREAEGRPFPEMVKLEEGLWHCVHPEFLADQLERSLDRLELECLDLCLLHNPEYDLRHAATEGTPLEAAQERFYGRLEAAFAHLESEVAAGRIGAYGVSSNTVTAPVVAADGTSLARILEAARRAGGEAHHFRALQLPANLFESGALFEHNTQDAAGGATTVLELARREAIAVLVNRPLNAFTASGLVRLSGVRVEAVDVELDGQLERVAELEAEFRDSVAAQLGDTSQLDPAATFRWTDELRQLRPRLHGLEQADQVVAQIVAVVHRVSGFLDQTLKGEAGRRWVLWRERYFPELERLFAALRVELARKSEARSAAVSAAVDPLLPAERRGEPLSRKALWTLTSTPGIDVVLCGMRRQEYVDDAVAVLDWPPLAAPERLYQAMRGVTLPG